MDRPAEIMASRLDGQTLRVAVCLAGEIEPATVILEVGEDETGRFVEAITSSSDAAADWAHGESDSLLREWVRLRNREVARG